MRVAFGLGRLHHVFSAKRREAIILGAVDAGCTHFDIAPCYGDGLNELEVGRVLGNRRDRVTIATKFGIPFEPIGELPTLQYLARKTAGRFLSKRYGANYRQRVFGPEAVVASLEGSLRRMNVDHVDYFLAHEPRDLEEMRAVVDVLPVIEKQRQMGKLRFIGVNGFGSLIAEAEAHGLVAGDVVMAPLVMDDLPRLKRWAGERELIVYSIMGFLKRAGSPGRLDVAAVLRLVMEVLPSCTPVVATNSLEEIEQIRNAIECLRGAEPDTDPITATSRSGGVGA